MKKHLVFFSCLLLLLCCEDVVEVELPSVEPKLVIDALIRVDKSKEYVGVKIRLSTSANYFSETLPTTAESVQIQYGDEDEYGLMQVTNSSSLIELEPGSGIFEPNPNFTTEQRIRTANINENTVFFLSIIYKDRFYFSRTKYVPTVAIDNLRQGSETLFNDDDIEIILTYTDQENRDDFYLFDFDLGNFLVSEDKFYKGQQFEFSYFYDQDLSVGQELEVSILGADRQFFNYMNLLIQQTEENFNIFDTPAATIRGNIFDFTDIDNRDQFDNTGDPESFPLGYFAVVQEYKQKIVVQEN